MRGPISNYRLGRLRHQEYEACASRRWERLEGGRPGGGSRGVVAPDAERSGTVWHQPGRAPRIQGLSRKTCAAGF